MTHEAKTSDPKNGMGDAAISHNEFASERRGSPTLQLQNTIAYDATRPGSIIRSPYVFGAALLASLGGFSFKYSTLSAFLIDVNCDTKLYTRSRRYLTHPSNAQIPQIVS